MTGAKVKLVLLVLLTIILGIAIFQQRSYSNHERHFKILQSLQQVNHQVVILNELVLKANQGLLLNYDPVLKTTDQMESLLVNLKTMRPIGARPDMSVLEKDIVDLRQATEKFLSLNAVINNSLSFLTLLVEQYPKNEEAPKQEWFLVHQLLQQIVLFHRSHEKQAEHSIENLFNLFTDLEKASYPSESDQLRHILIHGRLIFEKTKSISQQIDNIFNSGVQPALNKLRLEYMDFYLLNRQQAQDNLTIIYIVAFLLIGLVIDFILALRKTANSLKRANQELHQEISFRQLAENKQKDEARFLQTILENISDAIVFRSPQGELKSMNSAAEQFLTVEVVEHNRQVSREIDFIQLMNSAYKNQELTLNKSRDNLKSYLLNASTVQDSGGNAAGAIICLRDISERKQAETEFRLAATAFEAHEGIMIANADYVVERVNLKFTEITGYTEKEILGKSLQSMQSKQHSDFFYQRIWSDVKVKGYWQGEIYNKRKNGELFQQWASISTVIDEDQNISHYVMHFRDVTEHRQQQEEIKRYADENKVLAEILKYTFFPFDEFLVKSAEKIMSVSWLNLTDKFGFFMLDNQHGKKLSKPAEEIDISEIIGLSSPNIAQRCLCGVSDPQGVIQIGADEDCRILSQNDIYAENSLLLPLKEDKQTFGILVLILNAGHEQMEHERKFLSRVTDVISLGISRKRAQENVEYIAYHDNLTELPNRLCLVNKLKSVIQENQFEHYFSALLLLDFDRFKTINDFFGNSTGDALLKEAAELFNSALLPNAFLAYLGGDEFVVLLTRLAPDEQYAMNEAERQAAALHTAVAGEITLSNQTLSLSLSIGGVIISPLDQDVEQIFQHAEMSMYKAKDMGRSCTQFFLPEMEIGARAKITMEKEFHAALASQQIEVYYQPQINSGGQLIGAEALARWRHPYRGFISPTDFIALAEETGDIISLGRQVLEDACQRIKQWEAAGLKHIAVNVSPVQFRQADFVSMVKNVIEQYDISPHQLMLELTENILVKNAEQVSKTMIELKALGIELSIDDFGTGYSSLSYLTRFPLDQLKIDKCFVDDIEQADNHRVIIEMIIALAERLNLDIVAEGVECVEQLSFLQDKGCFKYQGYYFNKPLSVEEFGRQYLA